jgi:hypothetical protein
MNGLANRWRCSVWIALFAILFGALAPTISHAFAAGSGLPLDAPICTSEGSSLAPTAGAKPSQETMLDGFKHCAYCLTHAGSFALTPQSSTVFAVDAGRDLFPTLFYQAPGRLFPWTAAQSRAPPAAT